MDAYGYVETLGLVTAIEAADAALKAANVTLTNCYYVKGGIVTVEVTGDVAAVNAAVDAATESAKRLGNFLSNNVIARVDSETKKILVSDKDKHDDTEKKAAEKDEKPISQNTEADEIAEEKVQNDEKSDSVEEFSEEAVQEEQPEKIADIEEKAEEITEVEKVAEEIRETDNVQEEKEETGKETSKKEDAGVKKLKKQYQDMKVVDLKKKVDSLKLGYTWNQIKTMPKKKLIEILIKNNQEE